LDFSKIKSLLKLKFDAEKFDSKIKGEDKLPLK